MKSINEYMIENEIYEDILHYLSSERYDIFSVVYE